MSDNTEPKTEKDIAFWSSISPFDLSEKDRRSLLTKTNAEWQPHTWTELKEAIVHADLGSITRWPTELRKYIFWRREMKEKYPDISHFIITQRLHWPLPTAEEGFAVHNPTILADPADYTVLRNDWPYAVEPDVRAMVVWLKTRIPVNGLGEPTPESTKLIEEFVEKRFRSRVDAANSTPGAEVIWFKNPTQWQSVRTLEHFHVLTKGVRDELIREWTGQGVEETIAFAWTGHEPSMGV